MEANHFDVLIVGAGLSGIGAACHLQTKRKGKTFAILEGREAMGGTWDLFRYPGIRSDSDMYTLGYSFRPWTNAKAIADGPSILAYVKETAALYGVDKHVRYQHRVEHASWSSADARWTVRVADRSTKTEKTFTCGFLFACAGYYAYDSGYSPPFAGRERFSGRIVHPQAWPSDLDYAGKRIVVIGSGATAVTLVPELAKTAAHVTMLQRSPTYVVSAPERDAFAKFLRQRVPEKTAYSLTRAKNVLLGIAFYNYCRAYPERAKKFIVGQAAKQLGDAATSRAHFTPKYNPWDQRVCLVPDGDLFRTLNEGRASVVTDTIESFEPTGVRLTSGTLLEADIIVTATGLRLQFLGGMSLSVDGHGVEPSKTMAYKGMMLSDVPNFALAIGYTNASWTLKCDLTCEFVCRLLDHMDAHHFDQCIPVRSGANVEEEPIFDFSSGYVRRSIDAFPRQGSVAPWRVYQNYLADRFMLRHAPLKDSAMRFSKRAPYREASAST